MKLPENAQEYYDLLYASAYDGTFPSAAFRAGQLRCRYRLDSTANCKHRCAIGLLIPDEKYLSCLEGLTAWDNLLRPCLALPVGINEYDLENIQLAHDNNCRYHPGWDAGKFVHHINKLECFTFANVTKRQPQVSTGQ